mgnify:CR=1 FL=1|jgi:hypothetical protein
MRCKACNIILENHELSRKDKVTGEFLDLCGICAQHSNEALYRPEESEEYGDYNFIQEELAL